MTLYKGTASKQTAPSGGSGSFPTPVGWRERAAEPSFKGGADEAPGWKGEERLMEERSDIVRGTWPQLPMGATLSSPDSRVGQPQPFSGPL